MNPHHASTVYSGRRLESFGRETNLSDPSKAFRNHNRTLHAPIEFIPAMALRCTNAGFLLVRLNGVKPRAIVMIGLGPHGTSLGAGGLVASGTSCGSLSTFLLCRQYRNRRSRLSFSHALSYDAESQMPVVSRCELEQSIQMRLRYKVDVYYSKEQISRLKANDAEPKIDVALFQRRKCYLWRGSRQIVGKSEGCSLHF